jgi:hypothetical protein
MAVEQSPRVFLAQRHPVRLQRQSKTTQDVGGDEVRRLVVGEHKHAVKALRGRHGRQVAAHALHNAGGEISRAFHATFVPSEYLLREIGL